ncbi:MAG TPA: gas vesicle protein GvpN [Candidatus Brocadiia bacterium]|nr:gas vesicle protein GvpN [Planctomycetota bacterium]MDO8092994.1 gas vesicle protein GvpN [Candidatus Brocadiales bacterium]
MANEPTILRALPQENFVETTYIKELTERSLAYLDAGYPVHFRGAAGTGKTTLAMHIASKRVRPLIMIHGDDEFTTSDLIGGTYGYTKKTEVDNFISTVLKTSENVKRRWVDSRLTTAVKYGFTLIYDEFTRSRPEANNVLLSVLEEKMLEIPAVSGEGNYVRVDPNFAAIFTSNPEEYAGIHKAQDALRDRMITIDLGYFDKETELRITMTKARVSEQTAERIVNIVREFRETGSYKFNPTVRACIKIGRVLALRNAQASYKDKVFRQTCLDVLTSETFNLGVPINKKSETCKVLDELIKHHAP